MLSALNTLLNAPAPQMTDGDGRRITLFHQAEAPAGADALRQLSEQLAGSSADLLELYRRHNGLRLFAQQEDPDACLMLLPIEQMAAGKAHLAGWLQIDTDSLDADELGGYETDSGRPAYLGFPDWWPHAVVFACFGYTPECLLMPTGGEHAGKIFIYEHDGGDNTSQIAASLSDLFRRLAEEPLTFLSRYYGMYWDEAESYAPG